MNLGALAVLALAVAVVVGVWVISQYNSLVHAKALVDEGWSGIEVQLKRRYDLIPNLVAVVRGYSIHEKGIIEEIAQARALSIGAMHVNERSEAEVGLTQSLHRLFAVVENYPDLKASHNFLALQKELSRIEDELQLARRYYNGTGRSYNTAIARFPTRFVAGICSFAPVAYFEVNGSYERENPRVQF